ncbi:MAG: hypothetical protein PWQ97_481 [Tepidanaerobacteraceae bacterium]|nr:hypothetical protein [Tepidanaerobacteraceae bacterium]
MKKTLIVVLILLLVILAVGCGGKNNKPADSKTEGDDSSPAKVTSEQKPNNNATIEQLNNDLNELKSLYQELQDTYKANLDDASWNGWSAKWNQKRQSVFDEMKALYIPSDNPEDINYNGSALLGAGSDLYMLWQEYTKQRSGQSSDPEYFKKDFEQRIKEVEQYIEKHR